MAGKARALLPQLERQVEDPVITPAAGNVPQELPGWKLRTKLESNILALVARLIIEADSQGEAQ